MPPLGREQAAVAVSGDKNCGQVQLFNSVQEVTETSDPARTNADLLKYFQTHISICLKSLVALIMTG